MTPPIIFGTYLEPGDVGCFWRYYSDTVQSVRLGAVLADDRVVSRNKRLGNYLAPAFDPAQFQAYSFLPLALTGGLNNVVEVEAWMTGGRSFLLTPTSLERLGLPHCLYLDLGRLGWGNGLLELRFEVKGAGTLFGRSKIDPTAVENLLKDFPALQNSYTRERANAPFPQLFSSLAMYESRNLGGQREDYAVHSTRSSEELLGRSSIRFVPTLHAVILPEQAHDNLRIVSRACPTGEAMYTGRVANEIRCTPSTVRAVYLDRAGSDESLQKLCRRISPIPAELDATALQLAADVRRYLEHLVETTRYRVDPRHILDRQVFTWLQFGDIWVTFERDEVGQYSNAEEYRHMRKVAWYLAKDEVIVNGVGRMFVDMECLRKCQIAHNLDELHFQHSLYVLNVLRDHNRVATKLRIGQALIERNYVSLSDRRSLHTQVLREMVDAVNRSSFCHMEIVPDEVRVSIRYQRLSERTTTFCVPRSQMAEFYV